jgi:hypothetical protein
LEAKAGLESAQGGEVKQAVHHGAGNAEERTENLEKQRCPCQQGRLGAHYYCPLEFLHKK